MYIERITEGFVGWDWGFRSAEEATSIWDLKFGGTVPLSPDMSASVHGELHIHLDKIFMFKEK